MTIRALLADDHAVMRDGLKMLLEASGAVNVVAEVSTGREAVRCAQELKPDVVLMDVAMPELNGIEAARELRQKLPETRVVILSMYADAEYVYRALAAGAAGYILKESAGSEVLTAVRAVHAGRQYLSAPIAAVVRAAGASGQSPIERLTARERQILQLVVEGKSSAGIGNVLHLSRKTVETYRSRLMNKLQVANVPSLVKFALQHGVPPPGHDAR